jgi:hypothetical protein
MKHVRKMIYGLALTASMVGSGYALPVTLVGSHVDFTFDDALTGQYGQAAVAGDTLYFTPTAFSAQSSNGEGYVLAAETINIRATAHDGQSFSTASLAERGDYLLLGNAASADVTGQLRVFDTANPAVDVTAAITPSGALNLSGVPSKNWSADALVEVSSWNTGGTLNFTLENLLLASTTDTHSLSFVQKKYAGLTVVTSPVPEAQIPSLLLAGLGLIGYTVSRRRDRAAR